VDLDPKRLKLPPENKNKNQEVPYYEDYPDVLSERLKAFPQCCGSGSGIGTGSGRIRNFWPDPDPIRNRNKRFGSGSETGFESGSEKICKKEPYIQAKIR
jgi:hypothetical protein